MIGTVLELMQTMLNAFLRNFDRRAEDWVALSNIVDQQGRPFEPAKDKIVMVLANITHAMSVGTNSPPAQGPGIASQPALSIELFLVFFANFEGPTYAEGLAAISRIIAFFHNSPIFTHANMPELDPKHRSADDGTDRSQAV